MSEISKPDLTNNWGSLGGILEPDSTKIGLGWQEGESPLCEWQNWWQNRADASLSYLYQKGVPEWDTTTEYIANKSIVNYQGNLYLCTTTNTNELPTNASYWKRTGLALSDIPSASTSVKGIVQLNDTLSSTSTSLALTAKQGKALNDNKVSTTTTVNGKALSGNISLTKSDVGLGDVDDVKQLPNSYLDTSGTLASNSDVKVPSQKAVKTYADTKVPKTTTVNSKALSGNIVLNKTDIGLENVDNTKQLPMSYLDTSTTLAGNSDTKVPSQKAVRTYVDTKVGETPFRNRIINGDFLVNQRRATDALTLTASAYNADRWYHNATQASKASSQTIIDGSLFTSKCYLRMKTVSAATLGSGDGFSIMQSIEGNNVQDFAFGTVEATQITLSFWVKASQTGTYSISFMNAGYNRSYVTTYTISTADTWEYKTITINGDTSGTWEIDTNTGLAIRFDFGTGSTYTTSSTNTWLAGNFVKATGTTNLINTLNATLDLALVQLEKGGVATPFEYIPVSDSLARCERYYQKCYANTRGYAPSSGFTLETPIAFRTIMRAVPTTSIIAGTRGNASSVGTLTSSPYGARHAIISAAAGESYALAETAIFDAEL